MDTTSSKSKENKPSKEVERPMIAAKERGPGPGSYSLPSTLAGSKDKTRKAEPAYSFGIRFNDQTKSQSPGPGYYVNPKLSRHGPAGTPSYSMSGRPKNMSADQNPAPGTYTVEDIAPGNKRRAPAFSIGARTELKQVDETPGPTAYTLPATVGSKTVTVKSSMAVSISGRPGKGGFAEDASKSPGPGNYNTSTVDLKKRAPAYSLRARTFHSKSDQLQMPGPGAHNPEAVTVTKSRGPAFSMGIRHSEYTTSLIVDVVE